MPGSPPVKPAIVPLAFDRLDLLVAHLLAPCLELLELFGRVVPLVHRHHLRDVASKGGRASSGASLGDQLSADHHHRGALQHLGVVARVGVVEDEVRGRALLEVA